MYMHVAILNMQWDETYMLVWILVECLWATKIDKVGLVCIEWSSLTEIYLKPLWSNKKSVYQLVAFRLSPGSYVTRRDHFYLRMLFRAFISY